PKAIRPRSGRTRPAMARSTLDFPEPEGPTRARVSAPSEKPSSNRKLRRGSPISTSSPGALMRSGLDDDLHRLTGAGEAEGLLDLAERHPVGDERARVDPAGREQRQRVAGVEGPRRVRRLER